MLCEASDTIANSDNDVLSDSLISDENMFETTSHTTDCCSSSDSDNNYS